MSVFGILLVTFGLVQQTGWSALFASETVSGQVSRIEVTADGDILAGGHFSSIGGQTMSVPARWNGTSWVQIDGIPFSVFQILASRTDDLYVVRSYTEGVSRWDDGRLISVGPNTNIDPDILTSGFDGRLYVGYQSFGFSGGGRYGPGVLRYDPAADGPWTRLGDFGYVDAIAVSPDSTVYARGGIGPDTDLFIGELRPGDSSFRRIAAPRSTVDLASDGAGRIFALVHFAGTGDLSRKGIHVYEDESWGYLGYPDATLLETSHAGGILINEFRDGSNVVHLVDVTGAVVAQSGSVRGDVLDIAYHPQSGDLLVAGSLEPDAGGPQFDVARWTGNSWVVLGTHRPRLGSRSSIHSMARLDSGELWVVGSFNEPVGKGIARWEGNSWVGIDDPFRFAPTLVAGQDARLYAFGSTETENESRKHIRALGDQGWEVIPTIHITAATEGIVDIRVLDVQEDGQAIAAGTYDVGNRGTSSHAWVAKWDGSTWTILGEGGPKSLIQSVLIDGSDLIVGGRFESVDGVPAQNIARWNGVEWSAIGTGLPRGPFDDQIVQAMDFLDGQLVAGGVFEIPGSASGSHLAIWDGSTWSPLGGGVNAGVYDLTVLEDTLLYVGGAFQYAGLHEVNNLGVWDGERWSDLGGGTDRPVLQVVPVSADSIWVAGWFTRTGDAVSGGIGVWSRPITSDMPDEDDDPDDEDPDDTPVEAISAGVYPNPAEDQLTIYVSSPEQTVWSGLITDSIGRVRGRLRKNAANKPIKWDLDVSAWPAGVYFVRLTGQGQTFDMRFVVTR